LQNGVLKLDQRIVFARAADEDALRTILTEPGMDLAGGIEDHVVLKEGNQIIAGGMLYQVGADSFHLLVLAVAAQDRGRGAGRRLLREICARPWRYCRETAGVRRGPYWITTVARGKAAMFYNKCGFQKCDFSRLPPPFDRQCEECPDKKECGPAPLVFSGVAPNSPDVRGKR